MKRNIIITLCVTAFLFFCFYQLNSSILYIPRQTVNARYVMLAPSGSTKYRNLIAKGVAKADLDYHTNTVFIACDNSDSMISQLQKAEYSGQDGIILIGIQDNKSISNAVAAIRKRNIPVVMLDHKMPGVSYDHYIGIDNIKAGKLAADCIYKLFSDTEKAAVIVNKIDIETQQLRYNGFFSEWSRLTGADPENIKLIEGGGDYTSLKEKIEIVKQTEPDIHAFFCADASSSVFLKNIFDALEMPGQTVVGFDTLNETIGYVRDGFYICAIGQDTQSMGYNAIKWLTEHKGMVSNKSKEGNNGYITGNLNDGDIDEDVDLFLVDSSVAENYKTGDREGQVWLTD